MLCRLTISITLHIITARFKGQPKLKQMEGVKAFFVNNPTRAWNEVRKSSEVNHNRNGFSDNYEMIELQSKTV